MCITSFLLRLLVMLLTYGSAQGNLGAVGEKVGGPLASDGMIGKNFTDKGAIGGTINDTLGNDKKQ